MSTLSTGYRRFAGWLAVAACVVLTACSTPQLTSVWRSPDFSGPVPKQILVIGISKSDSHRRIFEDSFARSLRDAGIAAATSYALLPESGPLSRADIRDAVTRTGSDAILVTRLLRVDQRISVSPGYMGPGYGGFYGWYGAAWASMPPQVDQYDVLVIESTLWDFKQEKVIWSGTSETIAEQDVGGLTTKLARVLIERMRKDGVL